MIRITWLCTNSNSIHCLGYLFQLSFLINLLQPFPRNVLQSPKLIGPWTDPQWPYSVARGRKINSIFLNSYRVSIRVSYTYKSEAKISCVDDNRVGRSNQRVISGVTLANTVDVLSFVQVFIWTVIIMILRFTRQISRHAHPRASSAMNHVLFTRFLIICPMLVLMKQSINVIFGSQFGEIRDYEQCLLWRNTISLHLIHLKWSRNKSFWGKRTGCFLSSFFLYDSGTMRKHHDHSINRYFIWCLRSVKFVWITEKRNDL